MFWCAIILSFVYVNLLSPFRVRNTFSDWMGTVMLHYTYIACLVNNIYITNSNESTKQMQQLITGLLFVV